MMKALAVVLLSSTVVGRDVAMDSQKRERQKSNLF